MFVFFSGRDAWLSWLSSILSGGAGKHLDDEEEFPGVEIILAPWSHKGASEGAASVTSTGVDT